MPDATEVDEQAIAEARESAREQTDYLMVVLKSEHSGIRDNNPQWQMIRDHIALTLDVVYVQNAKLTAEKQIGIDNGLWALARAERAEVRLAALEGPAGMPRRISATSLHCARRETQRLRSMCAAGPRHRRRS